MTSNKIDKKIGILGGGQLGKMLLEASIPLSLDITVMDQDPNFPAGSHTDKFHVGNFNNYDDVIQFGMDKDIISIEIEAVNIDALYELEKQGKSVFPQPHILEIIKDKGLQKAFYYKNELPTSAFKLFNNREEILQAVLQEEISIPFVQKSRKDGYDGKGVFVVKSIKDLENLFDVPSLVEDLVDIESEIAIIMSRNPSGEIKSFPAVEMQFHPTANLVEFLFSPSKLSAEIIKRAESICHELMNKLDIVGLLAVELFVTKSGEILINEVAPRPHNSGHHTIEACQTSQFSQMLRAILDLPLGDTSLRSPGVMINVLGEPRHTGPTYYEGLDQILSESGVHPHLYGKKITKPYRKMGHITVIDDSLTEAIEKANRIKKVLKVKSKEN